MSRLSIQNATKTFGSTTALDGISFDVKAGQIAAVLGPSGCGKSTLLSVIAGLESLDHGTIRWDGEDLAAAPIHQRGFGLMFQDYALFPHMNIFENIGFGLRMQKMSQDDIRRRVAETLELVGLP
ncbi:MAG: ATP-binding cassette domain-containing protein, partial [Anaerolineae bacterium]|nr:ATP-binding cassette domain-containing protein [Anaerolineae bacterium]